MPVNQGPGSRVLEPYRSLTVPCYPISACKNRREWYSQVLKYHNGTKARPEIRDPVEVSRPTDWRSALYRRFNYKPEPFRGVDSDGAGRPSGAGAPAGGCFMGGGTAPRASAVQAAMPGVQGGCR